MNIAMVVRDEGIERHGSDRRILPALHENGL